jgi:hypothetical protein
MLFELTDIEGVIDSFAGYLLVKDRPTHDRFQRMREVDREAALAEAMVFRILQHFKCQPELHDHESTGGADFLCRPKRGIFKPHPADEFVVEATSLNPDAVTERSGIADEVPEGISGGAFALVTRNIVAKAKAKATQLADYPMPRMLAIASSHSGSSALFNSATAQWALVSEPYWKGGDSAQYVKLDTSLFIKPGPDDTIVACRQSISAVMLISVHGNRCEMWGVLNPEPAYPFSIGIFSKVPFVRIAPWPIVDGRIFTEWVTTDPSGYSVQHAKARIPKELLTDGRH